VSPTIYPISLVAAECGELTSSSKEPPDEMEALVDEMGLFRERTEKEMESQTKRLQRQTEELECQTEELAHHARELERHKDLLGVMVCNYFLFR